MIFADSRYRDGLIFKASDSRDYRKKTTVFRKYPNVVSGYYQYTWVEGDRIDILAYKTLSNSNRWHEIMDINPEIIDPFNIAPGTIVRIPSE